MKRVAEMFGKGVHFVVSCFLVGSGLTAQCPTFEPTQDQVAGGGEILVIEGILMLDCCATCSGSPEVADAIEGLWEKLEEGKILEEIGGPEWLAVTLPDTQCLTDDHWTTDGGNAIVLNAAFLPGDISNDSQAAPVIVGCALLHEYAHSITLDVSRDRDTGAWSSNCVYWSNEVFCHNVELFAFDCIQACGCMDATQLTAEGIADLNDRIDVIVEWRDHFQALWTAAGCS